MICVKQIFFNKINNTIIIKQYDLNGSFTDHNTRLATKILSLNFEFFLRHKTVQPEIIYTYIGCKIDRQFHNKNFDVLTTP